jgi:APA family basic amino acid/polyamine antiporter
VPILGIASAVFLMSRLPIITWTVMLLWLAAGLVVYFSYSIRHSKVQALENAKEAD